MFLVLILGLCLLGILILTLVPVANHSKEHINNLCNKISLTVSLLILAIISYLFFFAFDSSSGALQFVLNIPWYKDIFAFSLGVDGISLSVMFVTALLFPIIIWASKSTSLTYSPKLYYSLLFLILLSVQGVFMARDLILFFIFWEVELIPTYLLLAKYGLNNSLKNKITANKFLAYTFASGAFLLLSILGVFAMANVLETQQSVLNFSFETLSKIIDNAPVTLKLANNANTINTVSILNIFFIFALIAFCIKLPSMPLHSWLINVHRNASIPILMVVAGILFVMGGYGLIRFSIELFSPSLYNLQIFLAVFATLTIIIAGFYALVQDDMRVLLAYSNISHLGFVLLTLASFNSITASGALFQIIAHALIAIGLVFLMGLIHQRTKTFKISEISGLASLCPRLFFISMFFAMTTLGLPLLMGFVAESLIFYGIFSSPFPLSAVHVFTGISALGIILTAAYMLLWLKNIFFGEIKNTSVNPDNISDISTKETSILGIIMLVCVLWGSFPNLLENKLDNNLHKVNIKRHISYDKSLSDEERAMLVESLKKQNEKH